MCKPKAERCTKGGVETQHTDSLLKYDFTTVLMWKAMLFMNISAKFLQTGLKCSTLPRYADQSKGLGSGASHELGNT